MRSRPAWDCRRACRTAASTTTTSTRSCAWPRATATCATTPSRWARRAPTPSSRPRSRMGGGAGAAVPHPLHMESPTPEKRGVAVPDDPALPALALVLDGTAVAASLTGVVGGRRVTAAPRYVRYKPGNKATVLHDVVVDDRRTCAVVSVAAHRNLRKVVHRGADVVTGAVRSRCVSPEPV